MSGIRRPACASITGLYPATSCTRLDLDGETKEHLQQTALAAYQACKLRDYGRIDMRLTHEGKIYVIEANPNPWLSSGAEFAMAAKASGRSYSDLMQDIVDLAMARYD